MVHDRCPSGDSRLHRLDARVKVVVALLLIVGIVITPAAALIAYPLLWLLIAALASIGGVGVGRLARLGGVALPFALAALALPFTVPGRTLIAFAGLHVSDAGLLRFATVVLKSWLSVQVTLLLSLTTPFTDLLWALSSLRVPDTLIAIVSFMIRYLDTLSDEAERLIRARAARSAVLPERRSGGGLIWRARSAGGMVGSLFLRSYERSERVYAAMLSRGFDGRLRRDNAPSLTRAALIDGAIPLLALLIIEGTATLCLR